VTNAATLTLAFWVVVVTIGFNVVLADRLAAQARVPNDGGLRRRLALPAFQTAAILIDHRGHQAAHREGLLAAGVGGVAE